METLATIYIIIGAFYGLISVLTIWSQDFNDFLVEQGAEPMSNLEKLVHIFSCVFFWPLHIILVFRK